ncbi:Rab family GTPase [Acetobacter indonesiensis]|uniref:Rab family GTPase n=1 Tax=Acetobacter indonesiensis TaxID=104101 RepID=UPI0039EAF716
MAEAPFPKLGKTAIFVGLVATIFKGIKEIDKSTGASDSVARLFGYLWNRMKGLEGKRIAVIGATASGKNSLIARLRSEKVPTEHAQTRGSEIVRKYTIRFPVPGHKPIEFTALKSMNVGGEEDERDRFWADACRESDIVFYLIDVKRLISNREATLKRFREDITWIRSEGFGGKNNGVFKSEMKLAIVANKIDALHDIYKNDADLQAVTSASLSIISEIDAIARSALGPAGGWLTGVYPLSTTDDNLFTLLFSAILADVAGKLDAAGRKAS